MVIDGALYASLPDTLPCNSMRRLSAQGISEHPTTWPLWRRKNNTVIGLLSAFICGYPFKFKALKILAKKNCFVLIAFSTV